MNPGDAGAVSGVHIAPLEGGLMQNVGVVGLGYVGLPLAIEFAEAGLRVTGVERDPGKISSLEAGESYIEDVATERLAPLVSSGAIRATDDYATLGGVDAVIICLPTPLDDNREPDLSMLVEGATETARSGNAPPPRRARRRLFRLALSHLRT